MTENEALARYIKFGNIKKTSEEDLQVLVFVFWRTDMFCWWTKQWLHCFLKNNVIYLQTIRDRKILEVHVDKGMVDGQKITFGGEGDQEPGFDPGDIIIVLDEKEHDVYKWVLYICSNAQQEEKWKCSSGC